MRGFAKAVGGWESRLEAWEREYLAGLQIGRAHV